MRGAQAAVKALTTPDGETHVHTLSRWHADSRRLLMAAVDLKGVVKSYDGKLTVIHGIDLEIRHGEFVVFVGPSGCGKSTLLRMIAGLETISGGEICIDGKVVNDLPPRDRDIAMVFQDYALYPHKNLYDNMAFGLRLRKTPEAEIKQRVMDAAKLLKIDHMLERKPAALSGGQRQRVAIGRAIVRQPKVFLFDEPLSNLDAQLRHEMRSEIKRLHQRLGATIIYVTHDQVEAMTMADRIAVLSAGNKMQYDTPDDIYNRPGRDVRRRLHRLAADEPGRLHAGAAVAPNSAARRSPLPRELAARARRHGQTQVRHPAREHHAGAPERERSGGAGRGVLARASGRRDPGVAEDRQLPK